MWQCQSCRWAWPASPAAWAALGVDAAQSYGKCQAVGVDLRSHNSTSLGARKCSGAGRTGGQALCSQTSVLVGNTNRGDKMTSVAGSPMKRAYRGDARMRGGGVPGAAQALSVGGGRRSPASPARWEDRSEASSPKDDARNQPASFNPGAATLGPASLASGRWKTTSPGMPSRPAETGPATKAAAERICVISVAHVGTRYVVVSGDQERHPVSGFARRK